MNSLSTLLFISISSAAQLVVLSGGQAQEARLLADFEPDQLFDEWGGSAGSIVGYRERALQYYESGKCNAEGYFEPPTETMEARPSSAEHAAAAPAVEAKRWFG